MRLACGRRALALVAVASALCGLGATSSAQPRARQDSEPRVPQEIAPRTRQDSEARAQQNVARAARRQIGPRGRPDIGELAYGEVLFDFYQEHYFSALVRLLAAESRGELAERESDAELLSGGLYLSYGEHQIAGRIFESLLEGNAEPEIHDRAWYFLASIWHQRGYVDEAAAALGRIGNALPEELEPERRMLHAQVLMDQGRFDEALTHLEGWPSKRSKSLAFAKYNIGVALVRLGRIAEGAQVLEEVGALAAEGDSELAALRDKANVAIGYAWLQAQEPAAAKVSLQRVRLNGPYSNKALLGVGWSDAEQSNYQAALAPWVELRSRDLLDSAVQESLLAVPYAYARLGADNQAAEFYANAIDAFSKEIARLDSAILAIRSGALLDDLLAHGRADESGWYWHLEELPDTNQTRYLYDLMSKHRFQEALKNYRDLVYLDENLEQWRQSLSAFDDILDTRQQAYVRRLPSLEASLANVDIDALNERRVNLESRLASVERNEDFVALGTPEQQQQWRELESMEPALDALGDGDMAEQLRHKQQFLKGLLSWDLSKEYKLRLWHEHRNLDGLTQQLRSAERLDLRVSQAREQWPEQFSDQSARVAALATRVTGLVGETETGLARQQEFLESIAVDELLAQRQRLSTYLVQAQFSLAAIYDRAAMNAPPSPGPTGQVLTEGQQ